MHPLRAPLVFAFLFAAPSLAQEDSSAWPDAEVEAAVGRVVEKALAAPGAVGFSVSVGIEGRVALEKGYGLCELEHEVPATAHTVFRIGSITKQFTSALVMRLVDQGQVDVDELAATYLPEVDFADREVTVRQLLNHSSGIASYTGLGPDWKKTLALELTDEELLALFTQAPPDFAPGERWKYNNSGYYLLGMLIEAVSGEHYPKLITGMCAPVGMPRTRYGSNTDLIKDRAQGYQWTFWSLQNDELIGMSQPGAAGALLSTAGELVRWTHSLAGGAIVSPDSYVEMTTPTVTFDGTTHDYGFGLMMGERKGQQWVGHGGGINGFNSMLTHYPEAKLVVCVLSNSEKASAGDLAQRIADVLLVSPSPEGADPEKGLVAGIAAPPKTEMFAYLNHGEGVRVVTQVGEESAPGTETAETFAWGRRGEGFVITHAGVLERVSEDGERTVLLDGYRSVRFPDVRQGDGAIVVAVSRESPQETAWHLILINKAGTEPIDLGPGYDPCFTVDGSGVVFEAFDGEMTEIQHLDLRSGVRRRLVEGYTPSASIDGKTVYFSTGGKLCSFPTSGEPEEACQVTNAGNYDRFASPSPDGEKLIFFRQKDGADFVIELTLATGAERVLIEGRVGLPTFRR